MKIYMREGITHRKTLLLRGMNDMAIERTIEVVRGEDVDLVFTRIREFAQTFDDVWDYSKVIAKVVIVPLNEYLTKKNNIETLVVENCYSYNRNSDSFVISLSKEVTRELSDAVRYYAMGIQLLNTENDKRIELQYKVIVDRSVMPNNEFLV